MPGYTNHSSSHIEFRGCATTPRIVNGSLVAAPTGARLGEIHRDGVPYSTDATVEIGIWKSSCMKHKVGGLFRESSVT